MAFSTSTARSWSSISLVGSPRTTTSGRNTYGWALVDVGATIAVDSTKVVRLDHHGVPAPTLLVPNSIAGSTKAVDVTTH